MGRCGELLWGANKSAELIVPHLANIVVGLYIVG